MFTSPDKKILGSVNECTNHDYSPSDTSLCTTLCHPHWIVLPKYPCFHCGPRALGQTLDFLRENKDTLYTLPLTTLGARCPCLDVKPFVQAMLKIFRAFTHVLPPFQKSRNAWLGSSVCCRCLLDVLCQRRSHLVSSAMAHGLSVLGPGRHGIGLLLAQDVSSSSAGNSRATKSL